MRSPRSRDLTAAAAGRRSSISVAADASRTISRASGAIDRVAHRADHRRRLARLQTRLRWVRRDLVKPVAQRLGAVDVLVKDLDHKLAHRQALASSPLPNAPLELHRHAADLQVDLVFASHRTKYA